MSIFQVTNEAAKGDALAWLRRSLVEGGALARETSALDLASGSLYLLGTESPSGCDGFDFSVGRGISSAVANLAAEQALRAAAVAGARLLLVEDDLARPSDEVLRGDFATLDETVVRWAYLDVSIGEGVTLLRSGASGYPLNAFVLRVESSNGVGLEPGSSVPRHLVETLAANVHGVIVSAFDAEAFLLWQAEPMTGVVLR